MATRDGYKSLITINLDYLCRNIDIKLGNLFTLLRQKSVITTEQIKYIKDKIEIGRFRIYDLVEELLDMIINNDSEEKFYSFVEALQESDNKLAAQRLSTAVIELSQAEQETKQRIRALMAQHYIRTKSELCLYEVSDDPDLCSLRDIYTRTNLIDVQGWPPKKKGDPYDSYNLLFQNKKGHPIERVLIYGHPGMGKSVLTQKIALDWADVVYEEEPLECNEEETIFVQNIGFMVYMDLREITRDMDMCEVLQEQCKLSKAESLELLHYLQRSPKDFMFLLDGWDEYILNSNFANDITKIATGKAYFESKLLLTSRVMEKKSLPDYFDKKVSMQGFSEIQAEQFLLKYEKLYGYETSLKNVLKSKKLWMYHNVPFLLCQLCMLSETPDITLKTVTDIFIAVTQHMIDKNELRKRHQHFAADAHIDISNKQEEYILSCKLAFNTLYGDQNDHTTFSLDIIEHILSKEEFERIKIFGLIHKREKLLPRSPDVYSFGHKNMHEFLAAVYIVNHEDALDKFIGSLTSLMKVYEARLLIRSICGLSPSAGVSLCNHLLQISCSDRTTDASECPDFSHINWVVEGEKRNVMLSRTKATDVWPFILECCIEMDTDHNEVQFPKIRKEETPAQYISLPMELDFNTAPIEMVENKIKSNIIKLNKGNKVFLVNCKIEGNWKCLLGHLAESSDKIEIFRMDRVKEGETCEINWGSFLKRLTNLKVVTLGKWYVKPVSVNTFLTEIINCETLVTFELYEGSIEGNETKLIETLGSLKNLEALALAELKFPKQELVLLCQTIATLTKLKWLHLKRTNLGAAEDSVAESFKSLKQLEFVSLRQTGITPKQSKGIWSALKYCKHMCHINMIGCSVAEATEEMCTTLKELEKLEILLLFAIPNSDIVPLIGDNLISILKHLPQSLSVLNATLAANTMNVVDIAKSLPEATALKFVEIYLPPACDLVAFKTEVQKKGVNWIASDEDWAKQKYEYFKLRSSKADKHFYINIKEENIE